MKMLKFFENPIEVGLKEALEEIDKFPKKNEYKEALIAFYNEKNEEIILNPNVKDANKDIHLSWWRLGDVATSSSIDYADEDLTLSQVKDIITHFYHGQPWMHLYNLDTSEKANKIMKKNEEEIKKDTIARLEKELGRRYTFACQLLSGDLEETYIAYEDETLELIIMKYKHPSGKYKLTSVEKKIKELIDEKKIKCHVASY